MYRASGVKTVKKHNNNIIGVGVEITRKLSRKGQMVYAVVVRNLRTGKAYRLYTYDNIMAAFRKYKAAVA